jgi:putative effector of murein hydrolase
MFDLSPAWSLAAATRSATSPIAIALAGDLHGEAALSAVLSILTGIVGTERRSTWVTVASDAAWPSRA